MGRLLADLLDRVIERRTGRRYRAYLAEFREMERWSREKLDAWRWERLRALLDHAWRTVPYWKEVFDRLGARPEDFRSLDHLRLLPPMTKQLIEERGDDLVSTAPSRGPVSLKSTGGSTGRNTWFRIDRETHDRRRAAGRLTEEWDGVFPGTRTAILWGASLETSPSRAARLYDRLTGRFFFSAYGIDEDDIRRWFDRLERFRPEVISSYPSILLHAARLAGKERCRRLGVRLIYTSAEALYPPVREELEDLFGAPVRNRYASREFGVIASDCPAGEGLHVMDMRLIVEVGESPLLEGPGELLVTDLDNWPMPFIRYRIEDVGVPLDGPCPCGRPWGRLASVEGRSLDVIVTPEGKAFGGTFFTIVFRPFDRAIRQFQVVQDRPDRIRVKLVPGETWSPDRKVEILSVLREKLGSRMILDVEEVPEIPPLPSGKRRFVVSEIDPSRPGAGVP